MDIISLEVKSMVQLERGVWGVALFGVLFALQGCGGSDTKAGYLSNPDAGEPGATGGTGGSGGSSVTGGSGGMGGSDGGISVNDDAGQDASMSSDAGLAGMGGSGGTSPLEDASVDASPDAGTDAGNDSGVVLNTLDRWVDPIGGNDANDGKSPQTAFKRIDTGLPEVVAGGTLWLMNGEYSQATGQLVATGVNSFAVPDGVKVKAVHTGLAVLGAATGAPPGFSFQGSGELWGVKFNYVAIAIQASTGNVDLHGLSFAHAGGGCSSNDAAAMVLSGTAVVTLEPEGVADYAGDGSDVRGFAVLSDSARLIVNGGTVSGLVGSICSPSSHFTLSGSSKLTLDGTTVKNAQMVHRGGIISMRSATTEIALNSAVFDGIVVGDGVLSTGAPVFVDGGTGTPLVTITDSTFKNLSGQPAILLGYENGASTPMVDVMGSTFDSTGYAIVANAANGAATPTLTLTDDQITASDIAGVYLLFGGSLTVNGGTVSGNGTAASGAIGGIYLGGTGDYTLALRDVSVTDNVALGTSSGGVVLAGSAASTFDLGTAADPGGNTFTGNAQTGVRVNVTAGVTVKATGNTWNTGVQASTDGTYSVVGPGAVLDVTTGDGANYSVGSGTLRLAENP